MVWVEILLLAALVTSLVGMAETFRSQPRRGEKDAPPYQRRWTGGGLSLLMAGQLLGLQLEGDTGAWAIVGVLVGLGAAAVLVGVFRAPAEQ